MGKTEKKSLPDPTSGGDLRGASEIVEPAGDQIELHTLPIGARLLVRSKKDWRTAAVSRIGEEKIVLTICSPTGRTYRLYREPNVELSYEGIIPILKPDADENWRENFTSYDMRW